MANKCPVNLEALLLALLFKRGYNLRAPSDQANTVVGVRREEGRGRKEAMGGKEEEEEGRGRKEVMGKEDKERNGEVGKKGEEKEEGGERGG